MGTCLFYHPVYLFLKSLLLCLCYLAAGLTGPGRRRRWRLVSWRWRWREQRRIFNLLEPGVSQQSIESLCLYANNNPPILPHPKSDVWTSHS